MTDVEEARGRWITERPAFIEFSIELEKQLQRLVSELGISAQVSVRAKEVYSLVKKLIAKRHLNYASVTDKVGARIVVRYRSELPRVQKLVCERFRVDKIEDTSGRLSIDKVGYQGLHIDGLAFFPDGEFGKKFPLDTFFAELQVRTLSQHLWSEISHDSFYKNDDTLQKVPADLRRRVHLMAGQVEVADREFERMNSEDPQIPAVQIFKSLEPPYYMLTAEKPNIEVSMEVIDALLPLYREQDVQHVSSHILERAKASEEMFRHVYSAPENLSTEAAAFLFQPEALMIYDCLLIDRDETVRQWNQKFPTEELERVAVLFGISLQ